MKNQRFFTKRKVIILASILCLGAAVFFLSETIRFEAPREEAPTVQQPVETQPIPDILPEEPEPAPEEPANEEDNLPHDKLFITVERQHYKAGDLRLVIPRISFDKGVEDSTSEADLERAPGLYAYAQLPGEGNRNVSIAGHRYKRDFYYIDTVVTGDYMYLVDAEHVYRYLHESSFVIEPDDWGPIYSQGFSCLTTTTCTPIGISDHRLVVRGKLDAIFPYTEDFEFLMSAPPQITLAMIEEMLRQYITELGPQEAITFPISALNQILLLVYQQP